jgi:hypothetical protein
MFSKKIIYICFLFYSLLTFSQENRWVAPVAQNPAPSSESVSNSGSNYPVYNPGTNDPGFGSGTDDPGFGSSSSDPGSTPLGTPIDAVFFPLLFTAIIISFFFMYKKSKSINS